MENDFENLVAWKLSAKTSDPNPPESAKMNFQDTEISRTRLNFADNLVKSKTYRSSFSRSGLRSDSLLDGHP